MSSSNEPVLNRNGANGSPSPDQYASALRSIAETAQRGDSPRSWVDLRRLIDEFLASGHSDGTEDPAFKQSRSELAVILLRQARRRKIPDLSGVVLGALVRLGPFGSVMALRLLQDDIMSMETAASVLSGQEPRYVLALLNRYLLTARNKTAPIRNLVRNLMTGAATTPPAETAVFLQAMSRYSTPVAFALQEVLLGGGFGDVVTQAMRMPTAERETRLLLHAISACRDPKLAEGLSEDLGTRPARLLPTVLLAIGAVGAPTLPAAALEWADLLLSHPERAVRATTLDVLAESRSPAVGKVFAEAYAKLPELRTAIVVRLPLLGSSALKTFFATLPGPERDPVAQVLLHILRTLSTLESRPVNLDMAEPADPEPITPDQPQPSPKTGRRRSLLSILGMAESPVEERKEPAEVKGATITRSAVRSKSYVGKRILDSSFEDTVFENVDFSSAFFRNVRFKRCRFTDVKLSGGLIKDSTFTDCVFQSSDLDGTQWFRTRWHRTSFEACILAGLKAGSCAATETSFSDSNLRSTRFLDLELTCVRFLACDLSGMIISRSKLQGTDCIDCHLRDCHFSASAFRCVNLRGCTVRSCRAPGLDCDDPVLSELSRRTRKDMLRTMDKVAAVAFDGQAGPPTPDAWEIVHTMFRTGDRRQRRDLYMADRKRRSEWTAQRLGQNKAEFCQILPLLMHTDFFDRQFGLFPFAPPCRITGYHPGYTALAAARKHFSQANLEVASGETLSIEAIYTIGSVGTIAMTGASDIDYWICCRLKGVSDYDVDALRQKLECISGWAESCFGLEAHFFLMDTESIRGNNFGFSDKESSGSAQALMLKEEFYRTALLVAGKKPVWWLVPPGCDEAEYRRALAEADPAEFIDLGHMTGIPEEEFFGASIWQIVKAVSSPFKSIMKLGVLENYTGRQDGASPLLCDRIKNNLFQGLTDIWSIDPYALMYRENADYYQRVGYDEALNLLKISFFLKTELRSLVPDLPAPERSEEKAIRSALAKKGGPLCFRGLVPADRMGFSDLIRLGTLINRFIIDTYVRVRDRGKEIESISITPEDLTKLGRKIFSTFSRRQHKIDRLPFVNLETGFFQVLFFSATGHRRTLTWNVQGGQTNTATHRIDMLPLQSGPSLPAILAWLVVNRIYSPGVEIKGDYSLNPVTVMDIHNLLAMLHDVFPEQETFATDIEEGLKFERVTKALVIINLTAARDARGLSDMTIVYSTNWGEMFCRQVAPAALATLDWFTLRDAPEEFIQSQVEQGCPSDLSISFYTPDRCQVNCPPPRRQTPR